MIAIASLVGGIFGKGGGARAANGASCSRASRRSFGATRGRKMWLQLRAVDDPEAPTTIHNDGASRYRRRCPSSRAGAVALARPGSVKTENVVPSLSSRPRSRAGGGSARPGHPRQPARQRGCRRTSSNALLVSGARVEVRPPAGRVRPAGRLLRAADPDGAGHPRARLGRPASTRAARLPGREPLRPARPRARLRVERHVGRPGHHRHVRRRALRPDGGRRRSHSDHYVFRGQCLPMEQLDPHELLVAQRRRQTPAGSRDARR